jgi:uncharacterized hydrophobic protein (TIGR00271 family)
VRHTGNTVISQEAQESDADRWRLQRWLGIAADSKPRVYEQIFASTEITSVSYWLEIFFSAGIATFGLVESSPAVIIGAMLISPLMGPIMAMGLALAAGDLYLGFKALINLLASVAVSIAFSGFLVWLLPFHSATSEIISRTNPNLLDLGIALLSGLAGAVVVCRGGGDGVTALPGVAIAVALMPPLCTMGFGLGSGMNLEIMGGAGLLFLTNLVAIVASAFLVFVLIGMSFEVAETSTVASPGGGHPARTSSHGLLAGIPAAGGKLRWRVLMILILLASIAVPLRRALLEVASETSAREAVQKELKRLLPANAIVSQEVSVGSNDIVIRLISTAPVSESKVAEARRDLKLRTRRDVEISVDAIASRSELSILMERLARPAAVISKESTISGTEEELLNKVRAAIREIWPSPDAPIQDFNLVIGAAGFEIDVRYNAAADLGEVPIHMVLQSLRTRLGMPDLTLKTERIQPAPVSNTASPGL